MASATTHAQMKSVTAPVVPVRASSINILTVPLEMPGKSIPGHCWAILDSAVSSLPPNDDTCRIKWSPDASAFYDASSKKGLAKWTISQSSWLRLVTAEADSWTQLAAQIAKPFSAPPHDTFAAILGVVHGPSYPDIEHAVQVMQEMLEAVAPVSDTAASLRLPPAALIIFDPMLSQASYCRRELMGPMELEQAARSSSLLATRTLAESGAGIVPRVKEALAFAPNTMNWPRLNVAMAVYHIEPGQTLTAEQELKAQDTPPSERTEGPLCWHHASQQAQGGMWGWQGNDESSLASDAAPPTDAPTDDHEEDGDDESFDPRKEYPGAAANPALIVARATLYNLLAAAVSRFDAEAAALMAVANGTRKQILKDAVERATNAGAYDATPIANTPTTETSASLAAALAERIPRVQETLGTEASGDAPPLEVSSYAATIRKQDRLVAPRARLLAAELALQVGAHDLAHDWLSKSLSELEKEGDISWASAAAMLRYQAEVLLEAATITNAPCNSCPAIAVPPAPEALTFRWLPASPKRTMAWSSVRIADPATLSLVERIKLPALAHPSDDDALAAGEEVEPLGGLIEVTLTTKALSAGTPVSQAPLLAALAERQPSPGLFGLAIDHLLLATVSACSSTGGSISNLELGGDGLLTEASLCALAGELWGKEVMIRLVGCFDTMVQRRGELYSWLGRSGVSFDAAKESLPRYVARVRNVLLALDDTAGEGVAAEHGPSLAVLGASAGSAPLSRFAVNVMSCALGSGALRKGAWAGLRWANSLVTCFASTPLTSPLSVECVMRARSVGWMIGSACGCDRFVGGDRWMWGKGGAGFARAASLCVEFEEWCVSQLVAASLSSERLLRPLSTVCESVGAITCCFPECLMPFSSLHVRPQSCRLVCSSSGDAPAVWFSRPVPRARELWMWDLSAWPGQHGRFLGRAAEARALSAPSSALSSTECHSPSRVGGSLGRRAYVPDLDAASDLSAWLVGGPHRSVVSLFNDSERLQCLLVVLPQAARLTLFPPPHSAVVLSVFRQQEEGSWIKVGTSRTSGVPFASHADARAPLDMDVPIPGGRAVVGPTVRVGIACGYQFSPVSGAFSWSVSRMGPDDRHWFGTTLVDLPGFDEAS
jgi:hypothetical protein